MCKGTSKNSDYQEKMLYAHLWARKPRVLSSATPAANGSNHAIRYSVAVQDAPLNCSGASAFCSGASGDSCGACATGIWLTFLQFLQLKCAVRNYQKEKENNYCLNFRKLSKELLASQAAARPLVACYRRDARKPSGANSTLESYHKQMWRKFFLDIGSCDYMMATSGNPLCME